MNVHIPVLLQEMLAVLAPEKGGIYVDATYGGGGYTDLILQSGASVIALDRDPEAKARSARHESHPNFTFIAARFAEMEDAVRPHAPLGVDGVVMDIGVSSFQIDDAARGFSFNADGPLDMRMDPSTGQSAADLVNTLDETALADIFYRYGEERHSRRIARAVVAARPFTTTAQLANVIEKTIPRGGDKMHPATRCFQALRIAVNDELGELERGLEAAESLLCEGGRLVVVTFHSLEDRIVKQFMSERAGRTANASRYLPQAANENKPSLRLLNVKPVTPDEEELRRNPRARSAKLRAAVKLSVEAA